ncbi:hypothetical protein F5X68DRAFT_265027 [Plectosphaerella plurivora]|uniref:Uncharacterized protein n=1 Tax=Plectosphaerella plurivora TaxID=936078 RepID=A0A9P9A6G6_9PEZI|nr:hypothetical protein F5X68DRAFT_265027 [Plectosphaerella plurivora]
MSARQSSGPTAVAASSTAQGGTPGATAQIAAAPVTPASISWGPSSSSDSVPASSFNWYLHALQRVSDINSAKKKSRKTRPATRPRN